MLHHQVTDVSKVFFSGNVLTVTFSDVSSCIMRRHYVPDPYFKPSLMRNRVQTKLPVIFEEEEKLWQKTVLRLGTNIANILPLVKLTFPSSFRDGRHDWCLKEETKETEYGTCFKRILGVVKVVSSQSDRAIALPSSSVLLSVCGS